MTGLTYTDVRPEDFDALHTMVSDWAVLRLLGRWPWPPDPDFTRSRCGPFEGDGFVWAIRDSGSFAGTIGITDGSLGYMLLPSRWGRGIATRAVRHSIAHAFTDLGLARITADVWHDNPASARVLEKTGFRETARAPRENRARGREVINIEFALNRADWLQAGPASTTPTAQKGAP